MSQAPSYNPKKARTKYACPIWVDAFLRDTLELEADEFGAFHLILYAMWSREACNMPDDDRKLARVSRCSIRLWKSRIRPVLEPFFEIENGLWISTRLAKEALKTEKFLHNQSNRKSGADNKSDTCALPEGTHEHSDETHENYHKTLKNNNQVSTVDNTTDIAGEQPTQETKRPSIIGGGDAGAREPDPPPNAVAAKVTTNRTDREQLLEAIGADPISGMFGPNGKMIGNAADLLEARRWRDDLGLTLNDALSVIKDVMAKKRDGPPNGFKYFTEAMQRHAALINQPTLKPAKGGTDDQRDHHQAGAFRPSTPQGRTVEKFVAAFARGVPEEP